MPGIRTFVAWAAMMLPAECITFHPVPAQERGGRTALDPAKSVRPSLPAQESSLRIEGAGDHIVKSTIQGPRYHGTEVFQGSEDFGSRLIQRFRQEYPLDEIAKDQPREWQKILQLRHWVHSRWPIDDAQRFSGDAFAILEKAKTGTGSTAFTP